VRNRKSSIAIHASGVSLAIPARIAVGQVQIHLAGVSEPRVIGNVGVLDGCDAPEREHGDQGEESMHERRAQQIACRRPSEMPPV